MTELDAARDDVQQEEHRSSSDYNAYLLAIAHARLGSLENARTALDDTGHYDEADSSDWFRKATLRLLREEALSSLRAITEIALTSSPTDRAQTAVDLYSRAIELSEDVPVLWRLRARAREQLGESVVASADRKRAVELEKESELRRLTNLASLPGRDNLATGRSQFVYERARYRYEQLGDLDGALEDCLFALGVVESPYRQTLNLYSEVHQARGTLEHADAEWLRTFSRGQLERFYSGRADYYQQRGQHDQAAVDRARVEWILELVARSDDWTRRHGPDQPDPWAHLIRARDHFILEDTEQAEKVLAAAAAAAPNDPEHWIARAGLLELWNHGRASEADWAHVINLANGDPLPWIRRGDWFARRGNHEQADADFSTAASLAPLIAKTPFSADVARAWQTAWASRLRVPVEHTNSIGMTFRLIPPGESLMGTPRETVETLLSQHGEEMMEHERAGLSSDGPPRPVRLTEPFYLGAFEVTYSQFQQFVESTGYRTEVE